ncbi:MAG TPA: hypothetical protein VFC78_14820 [Tepidisphaeraceae bacterium]|nr:hypothetical protein [Tepidisphaeraceae bacterium]
MYVKVTLTLLLVVMATVAIELARPPRPVPPPADIPPISRESAQAFARRIPELKLRGATTEEAMNQLGDKLHLPVLVDWTGLSALRIKRWDIDLHDVPLKDVLHLLFMPGTILNTGPSSDQSWRGADFDVLNGVLVVTIAPRYPAMYLRGYDVRDLLTDAAWGVESGAKAAEIHESRTNALLNLVSGNFAQMQNWNRAPMEGAWVPDGTANIGCVDGRLLVMQTSLGHRNVEEVLARLRAAAAPTQSR